MDKFASWLHSLENTLQDDVSVADSQGTGAPSQHATGSAGAGKKPQVTLRPVIEDYQLPQRYRRRPLDENEIAYINVC